MRNIGSSIGISMVNILEANANRGVESLLRGVMVGLSLRPTSALEERAEQMTAMEKKEQWRLMADCTYSARRRKAALGIDCRFSNSGFADFPGTHTFGHLLSLDISNRTAGVNPVSGRSNVTSELQASTFCR